MRILICGINFMPELVGIGKYNGEMAVWLSGRGHEVRVVTAPPYYPDWRITDSYSAWRYKKENIDGVSVWRCPVWVPCKPSGLKRIVHLLSFTFSCFPIMLRQALWRPDVIITIEPPLFCAPVALLTVKSCKAKAWLHIQDFEVDAAFELGLLPAGRMRRWAVGFEQRMMGKFHRVSTISESMRRRLRQKDVLTEQSFLLPNWIDLEQIYPSLHPSPLRKELGVPADQVVLLYSGNMGNKQGLEIIIEVARQLADNRQILFVLCGEGSAKENLQNGAKGLWNILWLPLQPMERLNDLLNLADIHLLPQKGGAADLVMPSKLTGMLASGRPVIATAVPDSELGRVIAETGVLVPPGDIGKFGAAIFLLAEDSEARQCLGRKAREYAEAYFNKETIFARFEQELLRLTSEV